MKNKARPKASELFMDGRYTFSKQGPAFDEAFPTVEEVDIDVVYRSLDRWDGYRRHLTKTTISEFVDCHNHDCFGGGVSIGQLLRDMVQESKAELSTRVFCRGFLGSPQGFRKYGPCQSRFEISIKLKYK